MLSLQCNVGPGRPIQTDPAFVLGVTDPTFVLWRDTFRESLLLSYTPRRVPSTVVRHFSPPWTSRSLCLRHGVRVVRLVQPRLYIFGSLFYKRRKQRNKMHYYLPPSLSHRVQISFLNPKDNDFRTIKKKERKYFFFIVSLKILYRYLPYFPCFATPSVKESCGDAPVGEGPQWCRDGPRKGGLVRNERLRIWVLLVGSEIQDGIGRT